MSGVSSAGGTSLRAACACSAHLCPAILSYVLPRAQIVAPHVCSELASEWTPPALSPPASCLQLYGAHPWWFCYSDNSLKEEPSLYNFSCFLPLLLLCVCIHTYICMCVYTHTHTYTYAYMYICALQGLPRAAAEAYLYFSCNSHRPVSPGCACSLC